MGGDLTCGKSIVKDADHNHQGPAACDPGCGDEVLAPFSQHDDADKYKDDDDHYHPSRWVHLNDVLQVHRQHLNHLISTLQGADRSITFWI